MLNFIPLLAWLLGVLLLSTLDDYLRAISNRPPLSNQTSANIATFYLCVAAFWLLLGVVYSWPKL